MAKRTRRKPGVKENRRTKGHVSEQDDACLSFWLKKRKERRRRRRRQKAKREKKEEREDERKKQKGTLE